MASEQEAQIEPETPRRARPAHYWLIALLAIVIVVGLVVSGILPRIQARASLRKETQELAVANVVVIQPKVSSGAQELVLPANVQAYVDAPIYARTSGYLKRWYVDMGAHVRQGQLLAEIDTPEVNQQLRQARADLGTAEANMHLSQITEERYRGLLKSDAVSKQEADNAAGDYAAKQAIVESARANVRRLEETQSFQKIYAPFSGVISARNTDVGALIDAGSSGGTRTELFHLVQPDKLRVYVNVPEAFAPSAKVGLAADLVLSEYPGKLFQGKLVRTADAIDRNTRTLMVEIDVDNPTGTLLSGAYAEVHLKLPGAASSLIVPVNTLLFRSEGLRAAVVRDGQHAELVPITIGHDYGSEVEVVSGLKAGDNVVLNPPDSLVSGQAVRVVQPATNGEQQSAGAPQ
ncbi:MAG: efflux RND transporter periplasmic adaptor subunit [Acidobacteriaceae bacterium]|nr:efflux RND transporter periplasmic adaptor subunit [Acidobacteriaceae bacterium]